jgi:23S rRNA (uracil1939-C5)-methyltransferase
MTENILTTTINSLSHEGRGIAKLDGKTLFLEGGLPGEEVNFVYSKRHSKYSEGKVVSVLNESPDRVKPLCPHFGICHGCTMQHLNHTAQIAFKEKVIIEQLRHIGECEINPENILPPITSEAFGYRRKARLSVKYVQPKSKVLVGFHESNGRFVADVLNCHILCPNVGFKITLLSDLIATLSIYNKIPQIEVSVGDNATALIFRCLEVPTLNDEKLLHDFAIKQDFQIYLQTGGLETIALSKGLVLKPLTYALPNHQVELNFMPENFVQVNKKVNEAMLEQAINILQPNINDEILDLFCGLGNFTLPLAKRCREIIGVEGDDKLVLAAKHNATNNQITNAEFFKANLNDDLSQATWLKKTCNKVILDPPRTGALNVLKHVAGINPQKILYISCNAATLARDAKELKSLGYKLNKIGMLDMFPQTSHSEAMAEFLPIIGKTK